MVGVVSWLATVWAVRIRTRWARPLATVAFVLGTGVALADLLVRDTSGDTGLPPLLGWAGMLASLAGLVAVVSLWRRRPDRA